MAKAETCLKGYMEILSSFRERRSIGVVSQLGICRGCNKKRGQKKEEVWIVLVTKRLPEVSTVRL